MKTTVQRAIIKIFCIGFVLAFVGFGIANQPKTRASSSGPLPSHTGAPGEQTCFACHSSFPVNSGAGTLTISGLPKIYFPNQEIPVTVTVNDANAKLYGFQATSLDGDGRQVGNFILPSQNPLPLQIITGTVGDLTRSYIEHTAEGITPNGSNSRSWSFVWKAPPRRIGRVRIYTAGNAADGGGDTRVDYIYTKNASTESGAAAADFDGDSISDIAVFRPSNGVWYVRNSADDSYNFVSWGANGDVPLRGDFDGDAKTDFALWRPSNGVWYVRRSSDGHAASVHWGGNGDIPLAGDFGGDGKTDFVVFRPSNGVWYILDSQTLEFRFVRFGQTGDVPLVGDFDADAKTDLAVFRAGVWYILKSGTNNLGIEQFGLPDDKPQAADYDGDGQTDVAVFRPSNGVWYFQNSSRGFGAVRFGIESDVTAAADYDGDSLADTAVYRNGIWYILQSSNLQLRYENFGLAGGVPITAR